jgi:hypothetical protein
VEVVVETMTPMEHLARDLVVVLVETLQQQELVEQVLKDSQVVIPQAQIEVELEVVVLVLSVPIQPEAVELEEMVYLHP